MQNSSRTDRILISVALAILLLAGSAFYFDGWMWGDRRRGGNRIGLLTNKVGDVRMKFEGDLKWQGASRGQDLVYNDSIYAGAGSNAKLSLGDSEMTVTENTLVVLRRQDQVSFLNLSYGNLFGKIAPDEKIIIDTGDGQSIEMSSKDQAQIEVRKSRAGKTELHVTSGVAQMVVNGKARTLDKTSRLVVDKKETKIEKIALEALQPRRSQVIYSEEPSRIEFAWKWSNDRMPASASENYKVEFSSTPGFEKLHANKSVEGKLTTSMNVSESLNLYYRVRGPHNELSQTEKVNFIRLRRPELVRPTAQAHFVTPAGQPFPVDVQFQRPQNMAVAYQIATDAEFKKILQNDVTNSTQMVKPLEVGQYFIRVRGELGEGHNTSWSAPRPFQVDRRIEALELAGAPAQNRVVIPNREYPLTAYTASAAQVSRFLAKHGLMRDFFPFAHGSFEQLKLQFVESSGRAGSEVTQDNAVWPTAKMRPGHYTYRYQASKAGFTPTPWSADRSLEITMEPVRPVGEAMYSAITKNGQREAVWSFTPLLFAKSYDVELSSDPSFTSARLLKSGDASVKASLPQGEHYWRARARDGRGEIISEYSIPYKLAPQPMPAIPPSLARNEDRQPASAEERTRTRVERITETPFVKNGWWGWLGGGYNYVDYRQAVPGRYSSVSQQAKGPSEYLEAGFLGANDWGGVFSAKYTPGDVKMSSTDGDFGSPYTWTTVSMEGILRKVSKLTFRDVPVVYGLRVGLQEHRMPFLIVDSAGTPRLESNQMTTMSAGLLAEWQRRRWTYYWLMRYQYPISTKADGANSFSVDPIFGLDGSVGFAYNFSQQFKTGLFWYGQWHQYKFNYSDNDVQNQGSQSLFYSNIDLRFGFDF